MTATTLPSPATIALAAADDETYHALRATLTGADRKRFEQAVDQAYTATHTPRTLTERERRILQFAGRHYREPGRREQAIRDQFDLSATRYYQLLGALIDRPEALGYAPVTVGRLRALREMRRDARAGRTSTPAGAR